MTKPRRTRPPRSRSPLLRVLGYGGAALLVMAAVAVLLMPLFGDERGRAGITGPAAGQGATDPRATPSGARTVDQRSVRTQSPALPQDPSRGNQGGQQQPNPGSGPVLPGSGGPASAPPCSRKAAVYQLAGTTLRVTVRLAGGGFANAEVFLQGRDSVAHNIKATDDKPRSIDFKNLQGRVQRVKMSLISAGAGAQTCDAQLIS